MTTFAEGTYSGYNNLVGAFETSTSFYVVFHGGASVDMIYGVIGGGGAGTGSGSRTNGGKGGHAGTFKEGQHIFGDNTTINITVGSGGVAGDGGGGGAGGTTSVNASTMNLGSQGGSSQSGTNYQQGGKGGTGYLGDGSDGENISSSVQSKGDGGKGGDGRYFYGFKICTGGGGGAASYKYSVDSVSVSPQGGEGGSIGSSLLFGNNGGDYRTADGYNNNGIQATSGYGHGGGGGAGGRYGNTKGGDGSPGVAIFAFALESSDTDITYYNYDSATNTMHFTKGTPTIDSIFLPWGTSINSTTPTTDQIVVVSTSNISDEIGTVDAYIKLRSDDTVASSIENNPISANGESSLNFGDLKTLLLTYINVVTDTGEFKLDITITYTDGQTISSSLNFDVDISMSINTIEYSWDNPVTYGDLSVTVDRTITVTTSGMDDGNLVYYTVKDPSDVTIVSTSSSITSNSTTVTITSLFSEILTNDGTYTIDVYAEDTAENIDSSSVYFVLDTSFMPADKSELQNALATWFMFPNMATMDHGDISTWNTQNITDMSDLFSDEANFNDDITNWNTSNVTTMARMFEGATSFNQNISGWNTSNVITMEAMFRNNTGDPSSFNQPLNEWDVASVTIFSNMFEGATSFNQNISGWNTSNVITMEAMFRNNTGDPSSFNQPLNEWDVASVTNFSNMFEGSTYFDKNLSDWEIQTTANLSEMFKNTTSFSQTLYGSWMNHTGVQTQMFDGTNGAKIFTLLTTGTKAELQAAVDSWVSDPSTTETQYGHISTWHTGNVTDMSYLFNGKQSFNEDISGWDTSNVTDMRSMFSNARAFNSNIGNWGTKTSNVESMIAMFSNAHAFNQNINSWDTSNVISMLGMFSRTQSFNQPLDNWTVDNVTDFAVMFNSNTVFNQNLSIWNIKTDARLMNMFWKASSFSQVLTGSWMSHTGDQNNTFYGTNGAKIYIPYRPETKSELQTAINEWIADVSTALSDYGDITLWNTEVITDMSELFLNANNFNDDISNWDVSNVTDFSSMFNGATSFDQNLTTWNIQQNATLNKMFFNASSFSQTLSGMWEAHTGVRTMMFNDTNGAYIPSPEIIDISFNWGTNIYKSTPPIDGEITVTTRDIVSTDIINVTIHDPLANSYEYTASAIENPLTIQIVNINAFSDEGTYTVLVHAEDTTGIISNIFTTYFLVNTVATIENVIPQFENATSNIDETLYLYDIVSDGSIIVYSKGIEEGQPINVDITDSSSNLIYSYSGNVAPIDMTYFMGDVSSPNLSSITIPKSDLMKREIMMNQELIGNSLYVVASSQDICGNTSTFTSEIKVEKTAEWAGSFKDAVDISSDLHVSGNVIAYEDISTNNMTIHNYQFPLLLDRIREQKILSTTSDGTELEWATKAKLGKLFEVVTCDISTAEATESTGENNFYSSILDVLLS